MAGSSDEQTRLASGRPRRSAGIWQELTRLTATIKFRCAGPRVQEMTIVNVTVKWLPGVLLALLAVGLAYHLLPPPQVIVPVQVLSSLEVGSGPNLATDRENFAVGQWRPEGLSATPNAMLAPDGSNATVRFTETHVLGRHRIETTVGGLKAGAVYTLSIYARPGERGLLQLEMRDLHPGRYGLVRFDLEQESAFGEAGDILAAGMQELPGGWLRCWAAMRYVGDTVVFNFALLAADQAVEYIGDGTSGLYVWGVQFEPGKRPKGYSRDQVHAGQE